MYIYFYFYIYIYIYIYICFLKKKNNNTSFNGLYRETFANVKSIKNEISYRNFYVQIYVQSISIKKNKIKNNKK